MTKRSGATLALSRLASGLMRRRPPVADPVVVCAVPALEDLGRSFPPYRRTFAFRGEFLDASHRHLAELPVDGDLIRAWVPGFLRPADALALYEHAFLAEGNVLEMGSAWGLSTTILGMAVRNSGRRAVVTSLEISPEFHLATAAAVADQGLTATCRLLLGDAGDEARKRMAERCRFGFAFIDHDHAYAATRLACEQLKPLLRPGGHVLFHDFNDERNRTEPETYGVHRAVAELARGHPFARRSQPVPHAPQVPGGGWPNAADRQLQLDPGRGPRQRGEPHRHRRAPVGLGVRGGVRSPVGAALVTAG